MGMRAFGFWGCLCRLFLPPFEFTWARRPGGRVVSLTLGWSTRKKGGACDFFCLIFVPVR